MSAELSSKCLLPKLLDSVFKEFEENIINAGVSPNPGQLLTKLNALFGKDILERALHLLDNWIITIFKQEDDNDLSFIEFSSGTRSLQFVRILPDVNYCICSFFQNCVLQLSPSSEIEGLTPTVSSTTIQRSIGTVNYICEHILALRLTRFLKPQRLRQETLPHEEYWYLYNNIFND